MIIDTHCHIYPDKIAAKAAQNTSDFYSAPVRFDGTLSKLLEAEAAAGVERIVVQSVALTPEQVPGINRFVAGVAATSDGAITALGTMHPLSKDPEGDFRLIRELGLKGVKLHADMQKIAADDRRCYPIYELCQGVLPVLMHAGDSRFNYSNPSNILPVLRDFKNLTVIAAHLGGWSVWDEAVEKLPAFENLYVDTSSTFGFTGAERMKKYIQSYDPGRVLFGADYPMWRPAEEIAGLLSLNLPAGDYDKIFFQNAARLYGIT